MKLSKTIAALLMCCSGLAACSANRVLAPIRPDLTNPERFVCRPAGTRPTIPAEDVIDLSSAARASTVPEALTIARGEVDRYVATVRQRERVVAGYVVAIEGQLFACSNNAAWLRDYFAQLPASPTPR